ncbi:MAG: hypothetical protein GF311_18550 [Candidatus Lokiarchaeota archaeon]|nr:hypothetical protein [Candidatus Lokiarchaeota archaeon]
MENVLDLPLWLLVCQSDLIAKAKFASELNQNDLIPNSYLNFDMSIYEIYKGINIPEIIPMRHYFYEDTHFPLQKMKSNDIIIFALDYRHDKYNKCFYFTENNNGPSFIIFDENVVQKIRSELDLQERLLKNFLENPERVPNEEKIIKFITNVLNPEKAEETYKKVESFKSRDVPALVKYMNDRRELPLQHIQLANKSENAFEAYRHYSPQQVIDLIAAILNHITGMRFGFIYNGETDSERDKTYKKWIIWLERQSLES